MEFLNKLRLPYREDTAFGFIVLCVFAIPISFSLYSNENFESIKFSLFLLCTGASASVFFWRQQRGKITLTAAKYFYWLLGAFIFWAAFSSLFAQDKLYTIFGFSYRYTSSLIFYAVLSLFIFLLLNVLNLEKFKFLLKVLVFDSALVSIAALLEGVGWLYLGQADANGFFRGPSLLGNIDYSAMFLAAILPLVVYFLIKSRSFWEKVYYSVTGFFIVFASFILASRGGLLAMALSALTASLLLVIFKFPKKYFYWLLAAFGLFLIFSGFFLKISRPGAISTITTNIDANTIDRLYAWGVSLMAIKAHPFVGTAPGNYALFFERNLPPQLGGMVGVFDDAHNIFLYLAATGGLVLLGLFLALVFYAILKGLKNMDGEAGALNLALLSSLTAWFGGASFNPVPIPMYMLFALLLAGLMSGSLTKREYKFPVPIKSALIILSCIIFLWGGIVLVSEHLLGFATREYYNQDYSQSYKLASLAFGINPANGLSLIYKAGSEIYLGKPRQEIIDEIKKVQALHKTQASSYVDASNLYNLLYGSSHNRNDLESAAANIQTAVKIDPSFGPRFGQLAFYYYELGDFTGSKLNAQRDLSLTGGDFPTWILLAKLYQLSGGRSQVIYALNKAFNLEPDIPQLKYLIYLAKTLPDIKDVPIELAASSPQL